MKENRFLNAWLKWENVSKDLMGNRKMISMIQRDEIEMRNASIFSNVVDSFSMLSFFDRNWFKIAMNSFYNCYKNYMQIFNIIYII